MPGQMPCVVKSLYKSGQMATHVNVMSGQAMLSHSQLSSDGAAANAVKK